MHFGGINKMLLLKIAITLYLASNVKCGYLTGSSLSGLFPPVFTPMDATGAVNVSVIPLYAKYLKSRGVDGVVVADLAGEGLSLSVNEKKKILDAWIIAVKPFSLKVIVQVGGIPTPDMLELTRYAETIRVDAILALPAPVCFFMPHSPNDLVAFIELLAKAAKSLPIFYYHYPKVTGVIVDIPRFVELAIERVPQFRGIKAELGVAEQVYAVNKLGPNHRIIIFNYLYTAGAALLGYDTYSITEINIFPRLIKDIITYTKAGEVGKARRAQEKLNKITGIIKEQGDHVSALKVAADLVTGTGIPLGNTRYPLEPISNRDIKKIKRAFEDADIRLPA